MNPLIRYPGGKRRIAEEVWKLLGKPEEISEPFAGGLAVSLITARPRFVAEAIPVIRRLYRGISLYPSKLWLEIDDLPEEINGPEEFNAIRAKFNANQTPAGYLALSASCFNGLARFNRKGAFNASCGKPLPRNIPRFSDEEKREIEKSFSRCVVLEDWREAVEAARAEGGAIYADPPYLGTFAYAGGAGSWTADDLSELATALPDGAVLSERATPEAEEILEGLGYRLALPWFAVNRISRGERTKRPEGLWIRGGEK